jgi:hypothetical protein
MDIRSACLPHRAQRCEFRTTSLRSRPTCRARALDKSLFTPEQPFTDKDLEGQAEAGVAAFLAVYSTPR